MPTMPRPKKKAKRIAEKVLKHLGEDRAVHQEEAQEDKELIQEIKSKEGERIDMKKQGYNDRLDESLGMRHRGRHSQSMKDRRDESKGMEKSRGKRAYSGDRSMGKYPSF